MLCGTASLTLFLAYSYFFTKTKAFVLIKKGCRRFQKNSKSPHFLNLKSINWFVLKIRLCFLTRDVGYSVHDSPNDDLCKSDVQVDI